MLKAHFDELAEYNRFTNQRLYDASVGLKDLARKRPIGLFFSSLHGTLNHLLVTDYIWLRRMSADGPQPDRRSRPSREKVIAATDVDWASLWNLDPSRLRRPARTSGQAHL